MTKLYANYRKTYFNKWAWGYTPWYLADQQFSDYNWLIVLKDNEVPESNYTKVNANWMKNLTKFLTYELIDWVDIEEFRKSVSLISGQNCIELFDTVEEAREDIRDRTDLVEKEAWIFIIHEEYVDEEWETIPEKLLEIN